VTEYGITLKVSNSKYKIRYNFMGSTLIFQLLYINVLNYRYFHTNCSTFFKNKNVGKIKKVKNAFFSRKIKKKRFSNVYYNYEQDTLSNGAIHVCLSVS